MTVEKLFVRDRNNPNVMYSCGEVIRLSNGYYPIISKSSKLKINLGRYNSQSAARKALCLAWGNVTVYELQEIIKGKV